MRHALLICLGSLLWTAAPATASAEGPSAVPSAIAGGHERGELTVMFRGGWPRLGLRAQVGAGRGLSPLLEVEATPAWRVEPAVGLGVQIARSTRGRLSAELLLGWQLQYGTLAQRGPSGVVRLRGLLMGRVVGAWLAVGTRHTLLFDRTTIHSATGTDVDWAARHRWSPHLAGGAVFALHPRVGLEVGMDLVFVDVGVVAVSLPGLHASLIVGVPPRPGR